MYKNFIGSKVTVFMGDDSSVVGELHNETSEALHLYIVNPTEESFVEAIINKKKILYVSREIKKPSKSKETSS